MHILMLADFYPPFVGGVARHVRNLSHELLARGHDVAVATLGSDGLAEFEDDQGVRVHRIRGTVQRIDRLFRDPSRRWAPPFPDPELTAGLRRIVSRERPDIVHAHTWLVHSFLPLKAWSGARLVVSLHEMGLRCAKKNLIYRNSLCSGPGLLKCMACSASHYGLAAGAPAAAALWVTSAAERAMTDRFLPVSRAIAEGSGLLGGNLPYEVIPNFVQDDVAAVREDGNGYREQLPGEEYLLFVGALAKHKGLDVLLQAHADLERAVPMVLVGASWGDTPVALPENVTMVTNWPHHAVMQAWQGSLMALVPSVVPEACPTVVMEAMASARPVIASRIGGMPDMVVHGENGLLVPPGDPVALRQAIEHLLADPDLRERMGRAGKRRVVDFQASTVVPRIESVYRAVLLEASQA